MILFNKSVKKYAVKIFAVSALKYIYVYLQTLYDQLQNKNLN